MNGSTDYQLLQQEYETYLRMWNDAKIVDGPNSPITRCAKALVEEVAAELALLQRPIVGIEVAGLRHSVPDLSRVLTKKTASWRSRVA
jgi:hypothetical protein